MKRLTVIGLNSGTSMDGVDAAIFTISPLETQSVNGRPPVLECQMIDSILFPFDESFRKRLLKFVACGVAELEEVCLLNARLGEIFADAVLHLLRKAGLDRKSIDLIGSHGQTIWHCPDGGRLWGHEASGTLQLGEPAVIAARTGIAVIGDFRAADLAVGGQGAPLVAFADEVLFGGQGIATGVLNIGGIANLTVIGDKGRAIMAFDTGPGNMLIDRACEVLFQTSYDEGGRIAFCGNTDEVLLAELMGHPYFQRKPPKTTGRELFGNKYFDLKIGSAMKERNLKNNDLVATITSLTARSIAEAYKSFVLDEQRLKRLVLGGGGADNPYLVEKIRQYWPHELEILRHEDFGISTKFKESLLFALLAYTTYFGIPNNVPSCTGASRQVCLGKIVRA
ncbi:MAG TPA: anhydro-N-acetylmuramic acid kinase [Candidatus Obscuribacterales bacterium]